MLNVIFSSVPDHRVTGRCTYQLSDLLTIALLTYLCGGEDYVDMSEFANERARDFGLLEDCPSSPSPDTFERLMSAVELSEIERCLKDKENEITAIPQLLDKIDVEDKVVSIDAIGTQRSIVDKIIEKKGHYFLGVKDKEAVEDAFLFHKLSDDASQMECDHGRIETRDCRILPAGAIEDEEVLSRWSGLKTIV